MSNQGAKKGMLWLQWDNCFARAAVLDGGNAALSGFYDKL
jgi:hypothetical protein